MVGILVISHGRLATELLAAARTIEPALVEQARAITLEWKLDPEAARAEIAKALRELDTGDGVIVLTDMFGGTPSNLAISIMEQARIEVLAGVNLPMLVKLASVRNRPIAEAVRMAQEAGRKYITVASRILAKEAS